jgi:hypothetical protein
LHLDSIEGGVMKTALLISIAMFTIACDGSRQARTNAPANATGGGSASANTPPSRAPGTSSATVTLVGCLQGDRESDATGTSGATPGTRPSTAATSEAAERQKHGAAHIGSFVLANARIESGGVGANGAAATGGPVASAGSSFELDGLPADAQASVNKRVRVTGRLDTRPAATAGATNGAPATRDGSAATGVPSTTGETSPRDDVRANSTGVAGDSTNKRITVETVQVVAQQCGPE